MPQAALDALIRVDEYERRRLDVTTSRAASLTGGAAVVAALVGFLGDEPLLLVTVALLVVAVGLGAAAQWPYAGRGVDPHRVHQKAPGMTDDAIRTDLAAAIIEDIETTRSAATLRSVLGRVGLVIQVLALALLVVSAAV